MLISWMGHACFLLETGQGVRIITDPYESGSYSGAVNYDPVDVNADIVTVSHKHADHNHTQDFKRSVIVDGQTSLNIKGIELKSTLSYHDDQMGTLRGQNLIFTIAADGLKIVHFGDLGSLDMDLDEYKGIDVAIVPVGGTFTLGAESASELISLIKPKITIPMHFKTPKLGFGIDGVEPFLAGKIHEELDSLEVTPQNISNFKPVVVLKYQR